MRCRVSFVFFFSLLGWGVGAHLIAVEREDAVLTCDADFQPAAAFQIFNRTSYGFDIATGEVEVTPDSSYKTNGTSKTTHTTTAPPLPAQT